jgi:hypothetical protein
MLAPFAAGGALEDKPAAEPEGHVAGIAWAVAAAIGRHCLGRGRSNQVGRGEGRSAGGRSPTRRITARVAARSERP